MQITLNQKTRKITENPQSQRWLRLTELPDITQQVQWGSVDSQRTFNTCMKTTCESLAIRILRTFSFLLNVSTNVVLYVKNGWVSLATLCIKPTHQTSVLDHQTDHSLLILFNTSGSCSLSSSWIHADWHRSKRCTMSGPLISCTKQHLDNKSLIHFPNNQ